MNAHITFILSLSCGLPLLAYLFTYQRIDKNYQPLVLVFCLALFTELFVHLSRSFLHINNGSYYIYTLATIGWLYLYFRFYKNQGLFKNQPVYRVLLVAYIIFILLNWSLLFKSEGFFNFFRTGVVYAAIILFFSVELFSRQIFGSGNNILTNPLFLIGLSGVMFHAYYIFTTALILLRTSDGVFMNRVSDIQKIVNVLCYILYAIAVLCIPKVKNYIKSF